MPAATPTTDLLDRLLLVTSLLAEDQARFQREHDLSGPRVHLLWHLGLTGPVRQAELATALRVSPRNVTGLVDGLAASGHVRRAQHPTDRRAVLVSLTDAGEAFVASLQRQHAGLAQDLFGDLAAPQRSQLLGALDRLAARIARLTEEDADDRP